MNKYIVHAKITKYDMGVEDLTSVNGKGAFIAKNLADLEEKAIKGFKQRYTHSSVQDVTVEIELVRKL